MATKTSKSNNKAMQQPTPPTAPQKAAAPSKTKLQLSISEKTKKSAKFIALKNDTTVSGLFEEYIKAIEKNPQLIQLINEASTK